MSARHPLPHHGGRVHRRGHPHHRRSSYKRVWRWPVVLGILTLVGLLSALLADGFWDAVSWLTLGTLVLVCIIFGWMRRH